MVQTKLTVISFAQRLSLSVGTTGAFPIAGCVMEPMTAVTAVTKTASAKQKLAVPRRSSVPVHMFVSLRDGNVTGTKTVLMGLMRASKPAVFSPTFVAATSLCARTSSVSPSTLCVTMTGTAVTAPMSPRSASIRHVAPTSSAAQMDAASSRVHGSVMETSTAMITQMKLPRIHAAMVQRRNATRLHMPAIMEIVSMKRCFATTRMTVAMALMS